MRLTQKEGEEMGEGAAAPLAETAVFRRLSPEERAQLERMAMSRAFEPGELLVGAGTRWPYLLQVVRGEVHVCKISADGRTLVPKTLGPNEFFWGRPLFRDELMPVFLEATAPTQANLWPYRELLPVLQNNTQALWDLCQLLSDQMMRAADFIESLAFDPLSSRLARLLLTEFEPLEGSPQMRALSLDQMASQVGSSREVVCRLLHGFEGAGILALTRTELMITDLGRLKKAARLDR